MPLAEKYTQLNPPRFLKFRGDALALVSEIVLPNIRGTMQDSPRAADSIVTDDVIPRGALPPLRYRELPPPIPLRQMIGPSIILAGLALGSGEFILWPYITYKSGFVFFWACMIGVVTQFFVNMEISRWALATGESAITGFMRISRYWAGIFLVLNIIPWMIPAWATGAAELVSWLLWPPDLQLDAHTGLYRLTARAGIEWIAILGLLGCGAILTAGPVVYETVERIQVFLVTGIMVIIVVLSIWLVRWESLAAQGLALVTFGAPDFVPDVGLTGLDAMTLLGALAFAGAGGTMNLGQSNYIKEKGYGMGVHVGRISSPITGKLEPVSEIGFHFEHTAENMQRWRHWWRAANWEHSVSFLATCVICLVLLTLISHSIFYDGDALRDGAARYGKDMNFVLGEAQEVQRIVNPSAKALFLVMGIAILLTTEFGVLDAASRISTDIVKVAWCGQSEFWTEGRLYFWFLWGTILVAVGVLVIKSQFGQDLGTFGLFKLTSAMNGAVMFLYSGLLLYMNRRRLPGDIRISPARMVMLAWSTLFFGFFAAWAGYAEISKWF